MKITAFIFWALSVLGLVATSALSVTTVVTDGVARSVPFFDGLTFVGAVVFFSAFTLSLAGCIFWAAHKVVLALRV